MGCVVAAAAAAGTHACDEVQGGGASGCSLVSQKGGVRLEQQARIGWHARSRTGTRLPQPRMAKRTALDMCAGCVPALVQRDILLVLPSVAAHTHMHARANTRDVCCGVLCEYYGRVHTRVVGVASGWRLNRPATCGGIPPSVRVQAAGWMTRAGHMIAASRWFGGCDGGWAGVCRTAWQVHVCVCWRQHCSSDSVVLKAQACEQDPAALSRRQQEVRDCSAALEPCWLRPAAGCVSVYVYGCAPVPCPRLCVQPGVVGTSFCCCCCFC